jgi:hypothetical protein
MNSSLCGPGPWNLCDTIGENSGPLDSLCPEPQVTIHFSPIGPNGDYESTHMNTSGWLAPLSREMWCLGGGHLKALPPQCTSFARLHLSLPRPQLQGGAIPVSGAIPTAGPQPHPLPTVATPAPSHLAPNSSLSSLECEEWALGFTKSPSSNLSPVLSISTQSTGVDSSLHFPSQILFLIEKQIIYWVLHYQSVSVLCFPLQLPTRHKLFDFCFVLFSCFTLKVFSFYLFVVLLIKPRASQMLGKCSTTDLHHQPKGNLFLMTFGHKIQMICYSEQWRVYSTLTDLLLQNVWYLGIQIQRKLVAIKATFSLCSQTLFCTSQLVKVHLAWT